MLKKISGYAIVLMAMFLLAFSSQKSLRYAGGSPAGYTNSPYDNKTCTQCHVHVGVPHFKEDMITSDIPACGYIPGETYTINLSIAAQHTNKFGFICSPHDATGNMLGELIVTDASRTKIVGQQTKYATHTSGGVLGSNNVQNWSFDWIAPSGINTVTFYAAFTAGSVNNDSTFTSAYTVIANTSDIEEVKRGNSISVYPNPASEILFIENTPFFSGQTTYTIYNVSGQKLLQIETEKEMVKLDISSLPYGLYFLVYDNKKITETYRFIKQ